MKRSKKSYIEEMKERGWHVSVTEKDSYEDVKSEYETMLDELSSDIDMFPNGHDDGEEFEWD
jgi:hypothetical protein